MKLVYLTTVYPAYLDQLYARHPGLERRDWDGQRGVLERDAFGWIGVWPRVLAPLGHEVFEVLLNAGSLQRAWRAGRPGAHGSGLEEIALAQVRAFAPEVLWYDHDDEPLLARLRAAAPSIRRVVGWIGSWVPEGRSWRGTDLVLSCAPESVESLRRRGVRAELLPHGFDERVLASLEPGPPRYDVTFVGQIAPGHPLHVHRERLLEALRREVDVTVFSPSGAAGRWERPRARARQAVYAGVQALRKAGVPPALLSGIPALRHALTWRTPPRGPMSEGLRRAILPARFGLEMFQTLRDSRITLNIESGSTTRHSSNMRLFEATGVGTCLLTDRTEGLGELFEPEREVATYGSLEECVERIRRLLAHPDEREAIARAGQARTLREHTFAQRARRLDALLRAAAE
jgi:glycosyltransferase involved in cell wall biosynthesis